MPIDYSVDHEHRRVLAEGRGIVTAEELFGYQREVWSRPEVSGYDELVDMTHVERIVEPSPDGVRDLAELSATMDAASSSRFAIVAPQDLAFGLGRMYETYRRINPHSTKQVAVFRERPPALRWLDGEAAQDGGG